jgi:1,3-alpha-isomaltosidase
VIRHRPLGGGHPYLIEPDQRYPVRPGAGETFELGITTSEDVRGLTVELDRNGSRVSADATPRGQAIAREINDWGRTAKRNGGGHLASTTKLTPQEETLAWAFTPRPLHSRETLRYRFAADGETSEWFEVTGCEWKPDAGELRVEGPEALRGRLPAEDVSFLTDGSLSYRARFSIRLEAGERIVGFGERFDGVDQRGRRVDTAVFDQYKGQGARSYLPMPFAIAVGGGFGFHLDTGHRARFDLAHDDPSLIQVEVDLEPGERLPTLRLQLFEGNPADVLGAFLDQVGRASPPPEWIYRLWMSSNEWNSQSRVLGEVDRSQQEGIPVGAIVIEAWSDEETFVAFGGADYEPHDDGCPHALRDFSFSADGPWPDPKGFVDELHRRDIRVLLWQIPLAKTDASGQAACDATVMIDRGFCVRGADGEPYRNPGGWFKDALLLDFTNDAAVQWWLAKRRYLVEEVGVDGFKTDGGEHAWSAETRYGDGSRGGETNNRFPVLYARAYHQLLREAGRAPVTFSRAGYSGSQAFPAHWAGDEDSTWEALRASISAGITASACGVFFWSFDLAGFSGPLPTPELYLRAAAVAAFCPIMQYHSEFNFHRQPARDRTPWNLAEQSGDESVIPLFRRLVQLRERLIPYLAEQGTKSTRTSKPLMRGLFFESDDQRLWEFPHQFLLGDDLLVAPVLEPGVTALQVFLPEGEWIESWSGSRLDGGSIASTEAPLGTIPVYLAAHSAETLAPLFQKLDQQAETGRQTLMEVS